MLYRLLIHLMSNAFVPLNLANDLYQNVVCFLCHLDQCVQQVLLGFGVEDGVSFVVVVTHGHRLSRHSGSAARAAALRGNRQ